MAEKGQGDRGQTIDVSVLMQLVELQKQQLEFQREQLVRQEKLKRGGDPRVEPTGLEEVVYVDQYGKQHRAFIERRFVHTFEYGTNPSDSLKFTGELVDLAILTMNNGVEKWASVFGVANYRMENRNVLSPAYYMTKKQAEADKRARAMEAL
jgi:hypothetical protein